MPTHTDVEQTLAGIMDPLLGESVMALGMLHAVQIKRGGRVAIQLLAPAAGWPPLDELAAAMKQAVGDLAGVTAVTVQWIGQPAWTPQRLSAALQAPLGPLALAAQAETSLWARLIALAKRS